MSLDLNRIYFPLSEKDIGRTLSIEELEENSRIQSEKKMKYLYELLEEGCEEDAAKLISCHIDNNHTLKNGLNKQKALLCTYKSFRNKSLLFHLIIDVYFMDGNFFPRKLIQIAKKISKDIPEKDRLKNLPVGDIITVYRGSYTPSNWISKLKAEPSWTTNKNVAIWFAFRNSRKVNGSYSVGIKPANVYQAQIERNKIIAFIQDRDEQEVLQHCNVKDIKLIEVSEEEVETAFIIHEKEFYN